MILIALGANLPSRYGVPSHTLSAAKEVLISRGVKVLKQSRIWLTAPVPFDTEQDWYHNSVIAVETDLNADDLLTLLQEIETDFGRVRTVKNASRLLDLDLIAYNQEVIRNGERLIVPHPRMHERLFVLGPLGDFNKNWVHPVLGSNLLEMVRKLTDDQKAKVLKEEW